MLLLSIFKAASQQKTCKALLGTLLPARKPNPTLELNNICYTDEFISNSGLFKCACEEIKQGFVITALFFTPLLSPL